LSSIAFARIWHYMKNKVKPIITIVASLAVVGLASFFWLRSGEKAEEAEENARTVSAGGGISTPNVIGREEFRQMTHGGNSGVRIDENVAVKPVTAAGQPDDVAEEDLTELQKGVLAELQKALDDNDIRKVRKALAKFVAKAENGGLGGNVPRCMRMKAVEALGWFGKDAAIDVMEYMADADEEIASDASNAFEMALQDCEMSDYDRSALVKAAMQALNDGELIDTLLMQLNDMRNSVKVQTIELVLDTGTDRARQIMQEQIGNYTDSEVSTREDLQKWAVENPDDEGDAEFYGGRKD